jgi:L-gulonolactone oxidase
MHPSLSAFAAQPSEWRNWGGFVRCQPTAILRPRSEDELRVVLEVVKAEKRTMRVVGAGHSPSDLVATDGYLVSLDSLPRILRVEPDHDGVASRQVTCSADVRLSEHVVCGWAGLILAQTI